MRLTIVTLCSVFAPFTHVVMYLAESAGMSRGPGMLIELLTTQRGHDSGRPSAIRLPKRKNRSREERKNRQVKERGSRGREVAVEDNAFQK